MKPSFLAPFLAILSLIHLTNCSESAALEPPISAKLVTASESLAPGGEFHLGVHFTIPEPWHIYWLYPGELGLPTRLSFTVPEGFETSPVEWPTPDAFEMPKQPVGYGYGTEVLIHTTVKIPKSYEPGNPIPVDAQVKYLACGPKACVPGKVDLSAVVSEARDDSLPLFTKWGEKTPVVRDAPNASLKCGGTLQRRGEKRACTLDLTWRERPEAIEWFPLPPQKVKIAKVVVHDPSRITFEAELTGDAPPDNAWSSVVKRKGSARGHTVNVAFEK